MCLRELISRALQNSHKHLFEAVIQLPSGQVAFRDQKRKCFPNPLLAIEFKVMVFDGHVGEDLDQLAGG